MQVSFYFDWTHALSFVLGALVIALFWRRQHKENERKLDAFGRKLGQFIIDSNYRRNNMVGNLVSRIEAHKGGHAAIQDWELLDKLISAALGVSPFTGKLRGLWNQNRERVIKVLREEKEEEKNPQIVINNN